MGGCKCMLISHSEHDVSFEKYTSLHLVVTFIKSFHCISFISPERIN